MKGRTDSRSEVLEFLAHVPLFSGLSESCARSLAAVSRLRRVQKGEILFFDSDVAESVFVVRSGTVSIALSSPDGRQMTIGEVREGDLFGELGVLTGRSRSASAIARSAGQVLVVPSKEFMRVIDEEPTLARRVLDVVARRLQMSTKREMALAFMNAQARLARVLLGLEESERDRGYVTISQDELARDTGLIRQTVAKALGQWRRDGWLLTGRGRIVILNRKALEEVEIGILD